MNHPQSCERDCSYVNCDNICEPFEHVGSCPKDCPFVCNLDGVCETYETSKCPECMFTCNNDETCDTIEVPTNCDDCTADLLDMEVNVFFDENLNGIFDGADYSFKPLDQPSSPWIIVFLDNNQDGIYAPDKDPTYTGNYPMVISVRKSQYYVGLVTSSLGDLVIGYTSVPGQTIWNVDLNALDARVDIPVSINVAPVANNFTVIAVPGARMELTIISATTDRNNNLDVNTAIRNVNIVEGAGDVLVVGAQLIFIPVHDEPQQVTITYQICDTAGLCSEIATIVIDYTNNSNSVYSDFDTTSSATFMR